MAKAAPRESTYPIRAVARLTGLSVDAIRVWERRYQAVVPGRGVRGRVYREEEVARLKKLATLVEDGHAIGTIARLADDQLTRLLDASATARQQDEADPAGAVPLGPITRALARYDLNEIEQTLNRYAVLLPPRELVFKVVLPLLRELGMRWQNGSIRPSHEHMVSAIVRSVLGGLLRTGTRSNVRPAIVLATLPGEPHELGLLCTALLASSSGLGAIYLGASLPEDDIAHAVSVTGARIVVVSSTIAGATSPTAVKRLARAISRGELWIGGPGASLLMTAAGERGRHVKSLDEAGDLLTALGPAVAAE